MINNYITVKGIDPLCVPGKCNGISVENDDGTTSWRECRNFNPTLSINSIKSIIKRSNMLEVENLPIDFIKLNDNEIVFNGPAPHGVGRVDIAVSGLCYDCSGLSQE